MKIIIPILNLILVLVSFSLKYFYLFSQSALARLYTIDAVDRQLKSEILKSIEGYTFFALTIGLISTVMAVVLMHNKLCNKIIGGILLRISVLSVLFSLIMH